MWVTASKEYGYGPGKTVKLGEVFELRGYPNDGLLLKHALAIPLDPQPDKDALRRFPQCGECGRQFQHEWQRDACGKSHETGRAEAIVARREAAQERLEKLREAGELAQEHNGA